MIMPLQPPKDEKRCSYPDCSIHSSCVGECERKSQSETIAELMALKSELTGDLITERAKSATLRAALVNIAGVKNLYTGIENIALHDAMRQTAFNALTAAGDE